VASSDLPTNDKFIIIIAQKKPNTQSAKPRRRGERHSSHVHLNLIATSSPVNNYLMLSAKTNKSLQWTKPDCWQFWSKYDRKSYSTNYGNKGVITLPQGAKDPHLYSNQHSVLQLNIFALHILNCQHRHNHDWSGVFNRVVNS